MIFWGTGTIGCVPVCSIMTSMMLLTSIQANSALPATIMEMDTVWCKIGLRLYLQQAKLLLAPWTILTNPMAKTARLLSRLSEFFFLESGEFSLFHVFHCVLHNFNFDTAVCPMSILKSTAWASMFQKKRKKKVYSSQSLLPVMLLTVPIL